MADSLTISKQSPAFPAYLDFEALRAIGIDYLQQLSSQLWTDYNLHDPGVTLLEVLCYAVTDLGYRTNFDIQDLLALDPKNPDSQENNFFTPNEILTCNPVTEQDWRKRIIDIPGVRNVWIEKVTEVGDDISAAEVEQLLAHDIAGDLTLVQPALYASCQTERLQFGKPEGSDRTFRRLNPRGLYDVCLDLDPEPRKDACGVVGRSWGDILDEVQAVLCRYRNLCEDFRRMIVLGEEEIALCAEIELTPNADPEDVLVEIYVAVQAFLAPRLTFYTLQEMLAKGKTTDEIFAGRPAASLDEGVPDYPSHGFIDTDELAALKLPDKIHTSDLYQIIMDVPEVAAIKKLSIVNYINGLRQTEGHPWCLKLTDKYRPVLGVDYSTITFFKGDLPFLAQSSEVKQRYQEQQAAYIKARKEPFELDLSVPRGTYYDLADYYSIHHEFPLVYGISEDGLPQTAPAQRKAQANQLRAYLIFFDQILASYLAQLSHIRDLFSWESEADRAPTETQGDRCRTYFTQGLTNVPQGASVIRNFYSCPASAVPDEPPSDYRAYLDFISEDPKTYETRRNRFLDHLLARFAETFTDYVLLNYRLEDGSRRDETAIINDKARFLKSYPVLGRDRFRAFNYCLCENVWDSRNVSGFKQRVARLLGIDDFSRRNLSHYRVVEDPGGTQLTLEAPLLDRPEMSPGEAESPEPDHGEAAPPESDASDRPRCRFASRQIYSDAEVAAAQKQLTAAALNPDQYQRLAYRQYDAQNPDAPYTAYSYGLIDTNGQLLAERSDRFPDALTRDTDLYRWLAGTLSNQSSFRVEAATACFFVEIRDRTEEAVLLVGTERVDSRAAAIAQQAQILQRGQNRDAYEPTETDTEGTTVYSFVLRSETDRLATHPDTYATALERDLRLDELLYYLTQPDPVADISGEAGTYQATLLDRAGQPLLVTYYSYSTRTLAEAAYQRLLYLAADPVYFQILNDLEGDQPYGFSLVDRRGRTFATHPGSYPTACQRDWAIRSIINYVNKDLTLQFPEREDGIYIELLDQDETTLLVGDMAYATEAEAAIAAAPLLTLAQDEANFQRLDDGEADCPYGFALFDGETRLATHPTRYALESERDQALQALINCLIDADPDYEIDGVEGQFSYSLVDVLAAAFTDVEETAAATAPSEADADTADTAEDTDSPEESPDAPLLMTSGVLYPDEEAARLGFEHFLTLGADVSNYHPLDDLPAPNPYGFELRDEADEVVARPLGTDGDPIGYSTAAEREAAIAKIVAYLAQAEIQTAIANPEGAFFAEIEDDQGELVWMGQRTLPSPDAAVEEGAWIQQLAQTGDRYRPVNRAIGRCPYTFELMAEGGEIVARHPRFYASEAQRDRQMVQLQLGFGDTSAFVTVTPVSEETPDAFRFEIPAASFCLFHDCSDEQQGRLTSGSLLHPPDSDTFTSEADAQTAGLFAIAFAADLNNFVEQYDNDACNNNPNAQPFRFELINPDNGSPVAVSGRAYRDRAEMQAVIRFLQRIALGFTFTTQTPGTHCGYYFYLDFPIADGTDSAALRSLNRYASEVRAWQAASTFADNIRYFNRYVIPAEAADETGYGFGMTDAAGTLLAATPNSYEPLVVFRMLNHLDDRLEIESLGGDDPGYRFRLVEPSGDDTESTVWLQGRGTYPDAETAQTAVYRDVLGRLFEEGAIAPYDTASGYGFRVVLPAPDPETPPEILAIHPRPDAPEEYQFYPTAATRERAIATLKRLIRTVRLSVGESPISRAFVGHIVGADDTILLQGTQRFSDEAAAWQHGNTLIERAQNLENVQLIDDDGGTCFFSWELNEDGATLMGRPTRQFASADARKTALHTLQNRLNDEGFHILEHILLRPQQILPPPLPDDFEDASEEAESGEDGPEATEDTPTTIDSEGLLPIPLKKSDCEQDSELCLTSYDPYSFWISVVLPYWPQRFQDMNFRRFMERTLRLEAPAHVALKICWVDVSQMRQFDVAYRAWLEQFSLQACAGSACDLPGALSDLITILSQLENVYPRGTLHDCEESGPEDNPIILDQTALGIANC